MKTPLDRNVLILTFNTKQYLNIKGNLRYHGYNNFLPMPIYIKDISQIIKDAEVIYAPHGFMGELKLIEIMIESNLPVMSRFRKRMLHKKYRFIKSC